MHKYLIKYPLKVISKPKYCMISGALTTVPSYNVSFINRNTDLFSRLQSFTAYMQRALSLSKSCCSAIVWGLCVPIKGLCNLALHNPCVRSAIAIATLCWISSMAIQKKELFFPPSLTCVCKRKQGQRGYTALESRNNISITQCSYETLVHCSSSSLSTEKPLMWFL